MTETTNPKHRVVYVTEPSLAVAGESVGMRQSRRRPDNFNDLSPRAQWEIDKQLGILDWDGT